MKNLTPKYVQKLAKLYGIELNDCPDHLIEQEDGTFKKLDLNDPKEFNKVFGFEKFDSIL